MGDARTHEAASESGREAEPVPTAALPGSVPLANVPESLRFAETDEGRVPVVRVVAHTAGKQRYIREYEPDGELLRSTVQIQEDGE